jgi:hypothetical protein
MDEALGPYRAQPGNPEFIKYRADHDILIVERRLPDGRSLFFLVNKGDAPMDWTYAPQRGGRKFRTVEEVGGNHVRQNGAVLEVRLEPHSFLLLNMTSM